MSTPTEGQNRYELVERIAIGGMAEVFLAKTYGSHGFEKVLAIKRILPDLAASPEFERRFIAEAKIAVTLNHANIVQVLDFSRFGESLYIAMEFVDGLDLAALLKFTAGHGLPVGAGLYLAMEFLKGLDFAHRRGVVHRDISPSNVLVSHAGEVKIADFGIAQAAQAGASVTRTRRIMGKWRYMSPEQTRGDDMDARSDLFSAGAVLFEVFTGQRLFTGNNAEQIVHNIIDMPIPSLEAIRGDLPPALDDVVRSMLERDPARRLARASDALTALVDLSYERSLHATAMNLTEVMAELAPPRRSIEAAPGSSHLIDDIINSEVAPKHRGNTRVTLNDSFVPSFATEDLGPGVGQVGALTFVGTGIKDGGITNWVVEPTQIGNAPAAPPQPPEGTVVGEEEQTRAETPHALESAARLEAPVRASTAAPSRPSRSAVWLSLGALVLAVAAAGGGVFVYRAFVEEKVAASSPARGDGGPRGDDGPARATLAIESVPPGASVFIEGKDTNRTTPVRLPVEADQELSVELRRAGHDPCMVIAPATAQGKVTRVSCELPSEWARLVVKSRPPGATVLLDDRIVGKTPLTLEELTPSSKPQTLRLRLDEHKMLSQKIRLSAGETTTIDRRLVEKARFGTIDLYVEPWAYVYLGGKKIGEAPKRGLRLPVGRHRLRLVNPVAKRRKTITVTVPSSKPYRVKLPASN